MQRYSLPTIIAALSLMLVFSRLTVRADGQAAPYYRSPSAPPIHVQFAPDPGEAVNLSHYFGSSPPYIVPSGKDLVITDWAVGSLMTSFTILVNGTPLWALNSTGTSTTSTRSHGTIDTGLVARSGDRVELKAEIAWSMTTQAFAAGYLVDVHASPWTVRIPFTPKPADVVRIDSSSPFLVPANQTLVIRDWAATGSPTYGVASGVQISINGQIVWDAYDGLVSAGSIQSGVVALGGDTVTVQGRGPLGSTATALGFAR